MVEERITTVEGQAAPTTHTTIIHETAPRRSGGGMLLAAVLAIAVIGGLYIYSQSAGSESAKDNAVAGAADSVSNAADKIGAAADNAVDKIDNK